MKYDLNERAKKFLMLMALGASKFPIQSEYQALLDYADSQLIDKPSVDQQAIQNYIVYKLKELGYWQTRDVFYFLANDGSREFGYLNAINPGSNTMTLNNLPWYKNYGIKGNAVNYVNTNYIIGSGAAHLKRYNGSIDIYMHDQGVRATYGTFFGVRDRNVVPDFQYHLAWTNSEMYISAYAANGSGDASARIDLSGVNSLQTIANGSSRWRLNGSIKKTSLTASTSSTPVGPMALLANLREGVPALASAAGIGLFSGGADIDVYGASLHAVLNNYMAMINAPIIDRVLMDFAVSFRRLSSAATYSCQIERDSDDAITDVLLTDATSLTKDSLVSAGGTLGDWVGTDNVYIRTWYDQSLSIPRNLTQTVRASQLILFENGELITLNGQAACRAPLAGTDNFMSFQSVAFDLEIIELISTMFVGGVYSGSEATFAVSKSGQTTSYMSSIIAPTTLQLTLINTIQSRVERIVTTEDDQQRFNFSSSGSLSDNKFSSDRLVQTPNTATLSNSIGDLLYINRFRESSPGTGKGYYQEMMYREADYEWEGGPIQQNVINFYQNNNTVIEK